MFYDFKYITYDLTVALLNFILSLFFREIRPRGSHRIPKEGPVIFVVAPHANQFVDPMLVMKACGRRVSFLIAEKSMHQKGVGFFARALNSIPVVRPQDLVKKGKGTIRISDTDMLRIQGHNTEFTTQLIPKDLILIGEDKAEIVEVLSDTELLVKQSFKHLDDLLTDEGTNYKCMPHVEQSAVYKSVHAELKNGGALTLFPEGGSHDRMEMLPLKAGVTLMALGAMAAYPGLDVKIVPVGLNYFHAHRFRSRAVIEFGTPLSISASEVEKFQQGGSAKRQACGKLLSQIYDSLKSVTLNAESYETLMLIQAARRLYKPAHRKLHISQVVDLNRRFLIGYNMFKHEESVLEVEQRVLAYNQLLKYHGLRDHQVSKTKVGGSRTWLLLIKRMFIMLVLALFDFPGAILNLPVVVIARIISQQKAEAALKGSNVKVAGRDVMATWKLLVGLVLIPFLYSSYSFLVFLLLVKTSSFNLPAILQISVATWFIIAGISYASLRSGEIGLDIARSLKPMLMSIFDPSGAETLRQNREKLSLRITELINQYGPQVFPDFDVDYINRMKVVPTPTPSRSSSSSSFNLSSVKLPAIKDAIFHQQTRLLDSLHDRQLFLWNYSIRGATTADGQDSGFLSIGSFFSRSGSSTPGFLSRSSSFSAVSGEEPISDRIEDVYHIKKDE